MDPASWVLDDGAPESSVGVNGGTVAYQCIWMNLFTPTELPVSVSRIDIWWPGSSAAVGNAIQLLVYDSDGTPGTGTTPVTGSQNTTIATVGGFDQYTLSTPVQVTVGPSMLLGVVDRWIVSGTTPSNYPVAIDTTASQGRSWIGWWNNDPPEPPDLPPDSTFETVDTLGFAGNFMIRGAGTVLPVELQRFTFD